MRIRRTAHSLILLSVLSLPLATFASLPPIDSQGKALPTLAPMLEQVTPAVVNISALSVTRAEDNPLLQDPFFRFFFNIPNRPRLRQTQSLGSGVIVDAQRGYVLTNNHVIEHASEIRVTLTDGNQLTAKVVGADPEVDIAVLQIPAEKLTAIPIADSSRLRVGDFVVAIGNPFGLGQTVTSGIISALGRSGLGIEGFEDFIQTDASINPGNSGGALVTLNGELAGINTAIIAPGGGNVGIGFAIPANMASQIMEQIVKYGRVRRGQLGVQVQDLTPDLAKAFGLSEFRPGAVVVQVLPHTPAAAAGLKSGDIITKVNGREVKNASDVRTAVGLLRVGDTVDIEYVRDGKTHEIKPRIAEPKQERINGDALNPRLAGAVFSTIDENSKLYGRVQGVLVSDVALGSAAQRAGLRRGDIVVSVNRHPTTSLEELKRAVSKKDPSVLLNVQRGEAALFILLQ
jgi:Do/DeqQ family serine protease